MERENFQWWENRWRVNYLVSSKQIQEICKNIPQQQPHKVLPIPFPILESCTCLNDSLSSKRDRWTGQQRCISRRHGDGVIIDLSESLQLHSGQLLLSGQVPVHRQGWHVRVNAFFPKLNSGLTHYPSVFENKWHEGRWPAPPNRVTSQTLGWRGEKKHILRINRGPIFDWNHHPYPFLPSRITRPF